MWSTGLWCATANRGWSQPFPAALSGMSKKETVFHKNPCSIIFSKPAVTYARHPTSEACFRIGYIIFPLTPIFNSNLNRESNPGRLEFDMGIVGVGPIQGSALDASTPSASLPGIYVHATLPTICSKRCRIDSVPRVLPYKGVLMLEEARTDFLRFMLCFSLLLWKLYSISPSLTGKRL
jgi:hypothetical protein